MALHIVSWLAVIVLLLIDMWQTLQFESKGIVEKNVILGEHPEDTRIMTYFMACIVIYSMAMYLIRGEAILWVSFGIACVQIAVIVNNNKLLRKFPDIKDE